MFVYVSRRCPFHVNANCSRHEDRPEELEVINHRYMLHVQLCRVTFNPKGIVRNLHDPKQTGRLNTAVEVVKLHRKARTGLVEVNSNENERAPMMRAIRGNVFALKHSHVV